MASILYSVEIAEQEKAAVKHAFDYESNLKELEAGAQFEESPDLIKTCQKAIGLTLQFIETTNGKTLYFTKTIANHLLKSLSLYEKSLQAVDTSSAEEIDAIKRLSQKIEASFHNQ